MRNLKSLLAGSIVLFSTACSESKQQASSISSPVPSQEIVTGFVQDVVIPSYQDLAEKSAALHLAAQDLAQAPSEERLTAARAAWVAARVPWEQSEAFLFGPVFTYGYDPALDSWPLDHGGLSLAINAYQSGQSLDAADPNLKGFHAIEFLLFGYERKKTLADFNQQEFAYLSALTQNHQDVSEHIVTAWQSGVEGQKPFGAAMISAGSPDNALYASASGALQELLEGMVGIADEVANNKIAQPFNQANPNLIESQFSFNSLLDFKDNVLSIRNVYRGSRDGHVAANSLSAFVAKQNPDLDQRISQAITKAHDALGAIPGTFREAILEPSAHGSITAAQEDLRALQKILDQELRPLLFR